MLSNDPDIAEEATRLALTIKNWPLAKHSLARWQALAPNDPGVLQARAWIAIGEGRADDAFADLDALASRGDEQGWRLVAQTLLGADDKAAAARLLERVATPAHLARQESNWVAVSQLAFKLGDKASAQRIADGAVAALPRRRRVTHGARGSRSIAATRPLARSLYAEALKRDPKSVRLRGGYAALLADARRQRGRRARARAGSAGRRRRMPHAPHTPRAPRTRPRLPRFIASSTTTSTRAPAAACTALTLHLSAGLVALGGALLAWLRSFGVSATFRRWGVVFVMLCNVSLSLTFINLVDCGSPLAIIGYVDTVFGVGSLVVLLLGLRRAWESRVLDWNVVGVTALISYAWAFTAPQNIVLGAGLAGLTAVWTVRARDWGSFRRASVLGCAGLVAALAGALFGGMLMPKARLDPAASTNPDAMQTSGSTNGLTFNPMIFFKASHYGMLRESPWLYAPASYGEVIAAARPAGKMELFRSAMLRIEMQGWEALRILFFPVLGLLAGITLVSRPMSQTDAGASRVLVDRDTFLVAAAWILLVPGVALAFLFSWNGFKHELNRFLYPGIVTAQTLLVVSAFRLSGTGAPMRRRAIVIASAVLGLLGVAGPVIEMAFLINHRFLTTPGLRTILRESS